MGRCLKLYASRKVTPLTSTYSICRWNISSEVQRRTEQIPFSNYAAERRADDLEDDAVGMSIVMTD